MEPPLRTNWDVSLRVLKPFVACRVQRAIVFELSVQISSERTGNIRRGDLVVIAESGVNHTAFLDVHGGSVDLCR